MLESLDGGNAVLEFGSKEDVSIVEHALFQGHNDEL